MAAADDLMHIRGSLIYRQTWNFVKRVAAVRVPVHDLLVDIHSVPKNLVALRINCVNFRPGREYEDWTGERIGRQHAFDFEPGPGLVLLNRAESLNHSAIKEYCVRKALRIFVLLNIADAGSRVRTYAREDVASRPWPVVQQ